MKKYTVTVRTSKGTTRMTIEAANVSIAKEMGSVYGTVLSVIAE